MRIEAAGVGRAMEPPVFVMGAARSGTSVTYSLLLASGEFPVYETEGRLMECSRRYGSLRSSVKLASVLRADRGLSDAVRAGRNTLLTEALETWASGTTRNWQDPGGEIGVAVTVAGTFRTEGGAFCRRYLQTITVGTETRVDPGIACRTEGGWQRI